MPDDFDITPAGPDDGPACEAILRQLPEWFGIEEAIVEYAEQSESLPTWVARIRHEIVGFVTLERHTDAAAEIVVMGVHPDHHRRGIGRALVTTCEVYLRDEDVTFLQVKTVAPARECDAYARTRRFYRAIGFSPVQVFDDLWDEANPCLQMIKPVT